MNRLSKHDMEAPEGTVLVFNLRVSHTPTADTAIRYTTIEVRLGAQQRGLPGTSAPMTSHPFDHLKMHATGNDASEADKRVLFGYCDSAVEFEMFSDLRLGDAEHYTAVLRYADKQHTRICQRQGRCASFAEHVRVMGHVLGVSYGYMETSRHTWRRVTLDAFVRRLGALERAFVADEFEAALRAVAA